MSTIHSDVQAPSHRTVGGAPTGTRVSQGLVLTAVIALLAGLVGGYLLRWGTERSASSTPSTTPATATVVFDGVRAGYDGPTTVKAGTMLNVSLASTVTGATVAISRLDPAPSLNQLVRDVAAANTSPAAMPLAYVHHVATVTTAEPRAITLTRAGTYSIWAGPVAGPAAGPTVAVAALLHVTH